MAIDFSAHYGSHQFSDLKLVVYEEDEGPVAAGSKRKATPQETLPGHAIVLTTLSPYFKAKLDHWPGSTQGQHRKQTVELPVPPGQLAVGQLLVKSMYHAQLDLASVPQVQLIQLLLLADRFAVSRVMAAAAAAPSAIPTDAFAWDTVLAVHALPAGCVHNPVCQPLFAAAAAKVSQELGDLEAVWVQSGGITQQGRLLSLPLAALVQLLESSDTRVRSENTVANTVACWYEWQQHTAEQQPTREQLRQLVGLIRMEHCSRLYVSTRFASEAIAAAALEPQELAQACGMAGVASLAAASPLAGCQWPVLSTFPAWRGDMRPASAVGSLVIAWTVSKKQLEQLVQQALDCEDTFARTSSTHACMGYELVLVAEVCPDNSSSAAAGAAPQGSKRLKLFVYIGVRKEAAGATACMMECTISAKQQAAAGGGEYAVVASSDSAAFGLGTVSQPSDALQALQERHSQLLADGGCMCLRLEVSAVH